MTTAHLFDLTPILITDAEPGDRLLLRAHDQPLTVTDIIRVRRADRQHRWYRFRFAETDLETEFHEGDIIDRITAAPLLADLATQAEAGQL